MVGATLVLRDIHQPPAPPWWPPAPGWWWLAAGIVLIGLIALALHLRRRRHQAVRARLFDSGLKPARTPAEQVAAMSELLRRAARERDPDADRLQGDAWLERLDGNDPAKPFSTGPGRLLLDGAFRPDVDPQQVEAVRPLARARFLQWTARR
ncbi:DUF4381 domain-containing protein [Lysobacter korlensis]|uniref:DUF4381 domain-containing protein n=1 Tax=Lysobacter korlensis TaxID=553636 RepID=A0ABV6RM66_9GAMM